MKLVSSKQKRKNTIIAAVAIAIIVILVVGLVIALPKLINIIKNNNKGTINPTVIYGITVVGYPQLEYDINEAFNPDGLLVRVDSNNNDGIKYIDGSSSELTITGFDSSEANDGLLVTVQYKEFTTFFVVKIKPEYVAPPTVEYIKLSDSFKSTYTLAEWRATGPALNTGNVYIVLVYSDGTERQVDASYGECVGIDRSINEPGTTEFTVYYSNYSCTVTVTITE